MTNAIYFKGLWDDPFDSEDTQNKTFYVDKNKEKIVPTMNLNPAERYKYGHLEDLKARWIELVYKVIPNEIIVTIFLRQHFALFCIFSRA